MMLLSSISLLKIKQSKTNNFKTMNALALMVFVLLFLTSTLVHADHIVEQSINVEQQECHICNQGIDKPTALPQVQPLSIVSYQLSPYEVVAARFKVSYFVYPQLRAPPAFQ